MRSREVEVEGEGECEVVMHDDLSFSNVFRLSFKVFYGGTILVLL